MSDDCVLQLENDPATARLSLPLLLLFCVSWMIMVGPGATPGLAQETMIRVSTITTEAGQPFNLPIEGDWDGLLEGYSFSIAFPPTAPIENLIVDVYGSLVGSIEAEYVQEQVAAWRDAKPRLEMPPMTGSLTSPLRFSCSITSSSVVQDHGFHSPIQVSTGLTTASIAKSGFEGLNRS